MLEAVYTGVLSNVLFLGICYLLHDYKVLSLSISRVFVFDLGIAALLFL
jgi:hypothetical protein